MPVGGGIIEENYNYNIPADAFYSQSNLMYQNNN